jgi:intergrase/recombinase
MRPEESKMIDEIVEKSQNLVDRNWEKGPEKKLHLCELKRNQIRNILDMAQATDSFKALELFIRYQAGRETISHEFSEDLVKDLEKVHKDKGIEAVRLYLGHLYRYFVWKDSLKPGGAND